MERDSSLDQLHWKYLPLQTLINRWACEHMVRNLSKEGAHASEEIWNFSVISFPINLSDHLNHIRESKHELKWVGDTYCPIPLKERSYLQKWQSLLSSQAVKVFLAWVRVSSLHVRHFQVQLNISMWVFSTLNLIWSTFLTLKHTLLKFAFSKTSLASQSQICLDGICLHGISVYIMFVTSATVDTKGLCLCKIIPTI